MGEICDFVPQKLSASADDHQRAQAAEGSEIDRRDKRVSQEIVGTGSLAFLMDLTYQYIWICSSSCRLVPSAISNSIPSPGSGGQAQLGL